ncbi:hypothetical protein BpHYR1_033847 [Brachionus plicatilis]|uniref:Uncharacterized protein n=1 Tax=Brachionus plicatilis TaxID=10195 RepID=A0A3M7S1F5_BRAPC|nr:hypothetical protein BpHYR1_033847 [Brachionus plicatilis]
MSFRPYNYYSNICSRISCYSVALCKLLKTSCVLPVNSSSDRRASTIAFQLSLGLSTLIFPSF